MYAAPILTNDKMYVPVYEKKILQSNQMLSKTEPILFQDELNDCNMSILNDNMYSYCKFAETNINLFLTCSGISHSFLRCTMLLCGSIQTINSYQNKF